MQIGEAGNHQTYVRHVFLETKTLRRLLHKTITHHIKFFAIFPYLGLLLFKCGTGCGNIATQASHKAMIFPSPALDVGILPGEPQRKR